MNNFKKNLEKIVNTYYYGIVINVIPIEYDNTGVVLETVNLLTKPNLYTLTVVTEFAQQVWGNENTNYIINSSRAKEANTLVL